MDLETQTKGKSAEMMRATLLFVFVVGLGYPIFVPSPSFGGRRDVDSEESHSVACSPDRPATQADESVTLRAWTKTAGRELHYGWNAASGLISGQGQEVSWSLKGAGSGIYRAEVTVKDGSGISRGCTIRVAVLEPDRGPNARETGRAFLLKDKKEAEGYGLYSYLLLGSRPTDTTRERFLKVLDAYLGSVEKVSILEGEYYRRNQLNITYLPLDTAPKQGVTASWLLDHYDYPRARLLLSSFRRSKGDGIYIVSCLKPLSDGHAPPYLFQDLSAVPAVPSDLISWWIREFMNQAAQEHFWKPRTAKRLILNMRTTIAVLAGGLPEAQHALTTWITWLDGKK
jgi:hypothetical protein